MTFQSTAAASQFIDAIRYVCPCKVNPTPVPARLETYHQTPGNQTQCTDVPIPYQLPALPNLAAYNQVSRAQTMIPVTSGPASGGSILLASNRVDPLPVPFLGTVDNPSRPTTSSSVILPAPTGNSNTTWDTHTPPAAKSSTRAQPAAAAAVNPEPLLPAPLSDLHPRLSDGDDCDPTLVQPCITSSSLNSNSQAQYMPAQEISHDAIIASLRESTKLYDLSRVELEKLVGQVVREEGFSKLVSLFVTAVAQAFVE